MPENAKVKPLERFAKMTSDWEASQGCPLLMTYAADRGEVAKSPNQGQGLGPSAHGSLPLRCGGLVLGGLFLAVHAFLEGADAFTQAAHHFGNSSPTEKDHHNGQDD